MTRMTDMAEATRLTREGRLEEAMAILRGGSPAAPAAPPCTSPDASSNAPTSGPVIDMVPPMAGGAWTAPSLHARQARGSQSHAQQPQARPDLAAFLHDRLGARPRAPSAPLPKGARFEEGHVANAAGSRGYRLYVPSTAGGAALPLVVMLHGCTQSPEDFAAGTRMNEVAEEMGFLVAYPGQNQAANAQRCWNWFQPGDQGRGRGEPSLIAAVVEDVAAGHAVDRSRVYVAGLSAGGAQAAIMGAAYPEVFAAVGVHSGLACGAARDVGGAFAAMRAGGAPRTGTAIPTIVFHGDRDGTVAAVNGDEVMAQAQSGSRFAAKVERGTSAGGVAFTRTRHLDGEAGVAHEHWLLHGAGHAWSGGSAEGSYTAPAGPDASRAMARFFLAHSQR